MIHCATLYIIRRLRDFIDLLLQVTDLVENLHGDTAKIDALFIKEYANVEENDPNLINAIESILSTRLAEENYGGLVNLMKAFSSSTSFDDIEKALVSHMKFRNLFFQVTIYSFFILFI